MRKYQPIWIELKRTRKSTVLHPARLHARLIKAVLKERTMDTGFRFELAEANRCAKVFAKSDGNFIKFTLKLYLSPDEV